MAPPTPMRTYVMAYWPIAENAKRSLDHYKKHIALSLEMLAGQNLYFVSGNNAVLSSVETLCRIHGVNLHSVKMVLDGLPKRPQMTTLLMRAYRFGLALQSPPTDFQSDKGLIHYWRDLRQGGEDSFKKVFSVWHSKIDILHKAAIENPFGSSEFAWVDASVSRFNGKRAGWDFRKITHAREGILHHYPNKMRKNGQQLPLNASFLLGDLKAIEAVRAAYESAFIKALEGNYPNDEETVLSEIVSQTPSLFSVIDGNEPNLVKNPVDSSPMSVDPGTAPRKVLVVGTFRSGTNAMKACLEKYFDVEVTFNEWFWKHGVPPTGIQCTVPVTVPIVVMVKSPYSFHESLYPFWLHRRPNLDAGQNVSEFARKELVVFDVSGGNLGRPKYWYSCPADYWSHFYYAWLSWSEVKHRCVFVRYEDLSLATEVEILKLAVAFKLERKNFAPISLPAERVGPEVPTDRKGEKFMLNSGAKEWIARKFNSAVLRTFRYDGEQEIAT